MNMHCAVLVFVYCFGFVHLRTLEDSKNLYDHFFNSSKYKDVRPILNQSLPIQVFIHQKVSAVDNFDVTRGIIQVTGYVLLQWTDEVLQWDPSMFGDVEFTHLSRGTHWKPDVVLYGLAEENQGFIEEDSSYGFIHYSGQIMLFINANLKTRCDMDTSTFPFDSHTCTFQFLSTKHAKNELELNSPEYVGAFDFVENFEWEVVENSSKIYTFHENIVTTKLVASLVVKRRSLFILVHMFLPMCLLVCLNLFTSLVPLNSGERLSYTVTIFLAYVFLMNTMIEGIPANSLSISMYSIIFVIININNTVTVVISVVLVRMTGLNSSKVKISSFLKKLVLWKRKSNRVHDDTNVDIVQVPEMHPNNTQCNVQDHVTDEKVRCQDEMAIPKKTLKDTNEYQDVHWAEVAYVLDDIYLKFILFTYVVVCGVACGILWKRGVF